MQKRSILSRCVLSASVGLACVSAASAATLVSDDFTGGVPASYTTGGTTSGIALSAVDDSAGIGAGNALQAAITNTTSYAVRPFANTTLAVGDSITASFDLRFSSPATLAAGDRILRFGLYSTTAATNLGFTGRFDLGADANTSTADVFRSTSIFNTATANGSATLVPATTNADAQINDNLVRHITLTITRSADAAASGSLTFQKGANAAVTITGSSNNTGTTADYFTLSEFVIGINGTAGGPGIGGVGEEDFRIDNLSISTTPEPTSLALLGLGGVALLKRRRH